MKSMYLNITLVLITITGCTTFLTSAEEGGTQEFEASRIHERPLYTSPIINDYFTFGLNYTYILASPRYSNHDVFSNGQFLLDQDFTYQPGFKVFFSGKVDDNLELYLLYQWLHVTQHLERPTTIVTPGEGVWKLRDNTLTTGLKVKVEVSDVVTMLPTLGVQGLWQEQSAYLTAARQDQVRVKIGGVGPFVAIDLRYALYKGLGILGGFSLTSAWTSLESDSKENGTITPTESITNFKGFTTSFSTSLSLVYDAYFQASDIGIQARYGYELTRWDHPGAMLDLLDPLSNPNLIRGDVDTSLQGTVVGLSITF